MNFERLARHALERGDATRALFLLVEGFKRHEGSDDALRLMLRLYLEQTRAPGLERDIISIIKPHPDGEFWLAQMLDAFEADDQPRMVEALLLEAMRANLKPVVPPEALWAAGQTREDALEIIEIEEAPPSYHAAEQLITLDDPRDPEGWGDWTGDAPFDALIDEASSTDSQLLPQPALSDPEDSLVDDDAPDVDDASAVSWSDRRAQFIAREPAQDDELAQDVALESSAPVRSDDELHLAQSLEPLAEEETRLISSPNSSPHDATPKAKPRLRRAGFVGVMIFSLGLVLWSWWSARDSTHALDHQLERLDPLNAQPFERALEQAAERWGADEAQIQERREFLQALLASWLKHKEAPDLSTARQTPWGLAAQAITFADHGKFELSIERVTALEHQWPDALPTLWARGHAEERRGRYEESMRAYLRAQELFPQFVSGSLARLRMAMERDDELRWRDAREQLARHHSVHPYLKLKLDDALDEEDFLRARRRSVTEPERVTQLDDRFLEAKNHYQRAALAWRRGDLKSAEDGVNAAAKLAPMWFDARLLELAVHAARGDAARASALALAQGARQDLSPRARLRLMTVAPYVITLAGQAELALKLTFDPGQGPSRRDWLKSLDDATRKRLDDQRPSPLSLAPSQWRGYPSQVGLASYTWAMTLLEAGYAAQAHEVLSWLDDQQQLNAQGRLLRVWALLRMQRTGAYKSALEPLRDEPEGHLARAAIFMIEGHPDRAKAQLEQAPESTLDLTLGARIHIASKLANRELEQAQALLKAQPWSLSHLPMLRVLRQRVMSMTSPESPELQRLSREIIASTPTSMSYIVDVGFGCLMRGELEQARQWAERALARERLHPEAHMLLGLVLQHRRQPNRQAAYMNVGAIASDEEQDPTLHRQRGLVYLELGHYDQARLLLYRAVLKDRRDLQALRGLAQTYMRHDPALGRREFERFVQGYSERKEFAAQRGESLKWLGVLNESRQGKDEGLKYILKAEAEVGPRGDILFEQAEFYRARAEARRAKALYIAALQADTTLASAHLGLAKLALATRDLSQARDHLARFVELEPFGEDARWAQQTLQGMKTL